MTAVYIQLITLLVVILSLYTSYVSSFFHPYVARRSATCFHDQITRSSFFRLGRSITLKSALKSILDDDEVYTDFETMNSDNELEKKMARELYDELRAGQLGLSIESFLKWEDIEDVLNNGIIDEETMEIIIDEVGVKNGILSFEKFYELVELVNQVSIALDGDEELLGDGSDADNLLIEKEREEDKGSEEAYKWLFDAVSMGQGMKKKDDKEEV